jgi:hypothetical protein
VQQRTLPHPPNRHNAHKAHKARTAALASAAAILGFCLGAAATVIATPARAATIYLCKSYAGDTFWTNGTCANQRALIDRIHTVPDGMAFEMQVKLAEQNRTEAQRLAAPPPVQNIQYTTTTTTVAAPPDKATQCRLLSERITALDAMSRQPQTGAQQDWISGEKRVARDRQFGMRC